MDNHKTDPFDLFTEEERKSMNASMAECAAMPLDLDGTFSESELAQVVEALNLASTLRQASATGTPEAITATLTGPSKLVSIRIPHDVLGAFKREAGRRGVRPQTLVNQELRALSTAW